MDGAMLERMTFRSPGVSGDRDVDRLETDLGAVDGVRNVLVDTSENAVTVEYDSTIVNATRLRAILEERGYSVSE